MDLFYELIVSEDIAKIKRKFVTYANQQRTIGELRNFINKSIKIAYKHNRRDLDVFFKNRGEAAEIILLFNDIINQSEISITKRRQIVDELINRAEQINRADLVVYLRVHGDAAEMAYINKETRPSGTMLDHLKGVSNKKTLNGFFTLSVLNTNGSTPRLYVHKKVDTMLYVLLTSVICALIVKGVHSSDYMLLEDGFSIFYPFAAKISIMSSAVVQYTQILAKKYFDIDNQYVNEVFSKYNDNLELIINLMNTSNLKNMVNHFNLHQDTPRNSAWTINHNKGGGIVVDFYDLNPIVLVIDKQTADKINNWFVTSVGSFEENIQFINYLYKDEHSSSHKLHILLWFLIAILEIGIIYFNLKPTNSINELLSNNQLQNKIRQHALILIPNRLAIRTVFPALVDFVINLMYPYNDDVTFNIIFGEPPIRSKYVNEMLQIIERHTNSADFSLLESTRNKYLNYLGDTHGRHYNTMSNKIVDSFVNELNRSYSDPSLKKMREQLALMQISEVSLDMHEVTSIPKNSITSRDKMPVSFPQDKYIDFLMFEENNKLPVLFSAYKLWITSTKPIVEVSSHSIAELCALFMTQFMANYIYNYHENQIDTDEVGYEMVLQIYNLLSVLGKFIGHYDLTLYSVCTLQFVQNILNNKGISNRSANELIDSFMIKVFEKINMLYQPAMLIDSSATNYGVFNSRQTRDTIEKAFSVNATYEDTTYNHMNYVQSMMTSKDKRHKLHWKDLIVEKEIFVDSIFSLVSGLNEASNINEQIYDNENIFKWKNHTDTPQVFAGMLFLTSVYDVYTKITRYGSDSRYVDSAVFAHLITLTMNKDYIEQLVDIIVLIDVTIGEDDKDATTQDICNIFTNKMNNIVNNNEINYIRPIVNLLNSIASLSQTEEAHNAEKYNMDVVNSREYRAVLRNAKPYFKQINEFMNIHIV